MMGNTNPPVEELQLPPARVDLQRFHRDGFALDRGTLDPEQIQELAALLEQSQSAAGFHQRRGKAYAARNLLWQVPELARWIDASPLQPLASRARAAPARPIEAIFFDKTPEANWMVPSHQDRFLPVEARCDEAGFVGWTKKEGVDYVTPPIAILEQVVALRVHLDDCGADNGALWVSPGSHARGLLTEDEVAELPRDGFVACAAGAGDVLLMRPLLVHRSPPAQMPTHRRVLHIVYASAEPGVHVRWKRAIDS